MRKIILSFALCTLGLCAWADDFWEGGNLYVITGENTVKVTITNDKPSVEIPQSVTHSEVTYTITEIGDGEYNICRERAAEITKLSIPSSVTAIAANAFKGCSALTTIEFYGDAVPSCGADAFDGVHADCKISVKKESIKDAFEAYADWTAFYGKVGYFTFNLWDDSYDKGAATWRNEWNLDVVLNRTFNSGEWYTICVPAYLSTAAIEAALGVDAQIVELTSSTKSADHWELVFTPVTYTVASKPYLLKVTSTVTNPKFEGVYFYCDEDQTTVTTSFAKMIGTFKTMNLTAGNNYYLGPDNTLYTPETSVEMKGYRAYFQFTTPPPAGMRARIVVHENGPMDINNIETDTKAQKIMQDGRILIRQGERLYTIDGRIVK